MPEPIISTGAILLVVAATNVVTGFASFITTKWIDTRKLGEQYMKKKDFTEHCTDCVEKMDCKNKKLVDDYEEIKGTLTRHGQELKVMNLVQLEICDKLKIPKEKIDSWRATILNNR